MVVQAVRRTRRPRRGSTPVLNCAEAVAPLLRTGADPNARVGASDGGPAAVDEEHMPGHVARGIGGKEEQPGVDLMQRGVRARSVRSPTDRAKPSSARKPRHRLDPLPELGRELVEAFTPAGGHQHVRPSLVQHTCDARPETGRRSGHQPHPAIQPPSHIGRAVVWCRRVVSHVLRAIIPAERSVAGSPGRRSGDGRTSNLGTHVSAKSSEIP